MMVGCRVEVSIPAPGLHLLGSTIEHQQLSLLHHSNTHYLHWGKIQIFIAIFVEHIFSKNNEEKGLMVGAGLLAPVQYLLYCLILKEFIYIHITTMANPPPLTLLLIETNF